tara:strand:- start:1560 stop:2516 length:957 start_codon:yes stop_codon:yes gene_type:complete
MYSNNLALFCLEKKRRGGPIYMERLSRLMNSEDLTFIRSSRDTNFLKIFIETIFNNKVIFVGSGVLGALLGICLFYKIKKGILIHTPLDQLSKKSKFIIYLFLKSNSNNQLIFVANHLKNKYENHFNNKNIFFKSFIIRGLPTMKKLSFTKKNNNYIKLIFIGGDSEEKGIDFCVELIKYLNLNFPFKYQLHVYGRVKYPKEESNILFYHQFKKEPFAYYDPQSSIHIMPSIFEGGPLSVLDAAKYGIFTIINDIAAANEMKENGINSLKIETLNIKKWAKLINCSKLDLSLSKSIVSQVEEWEKRVYNSTRKFITNF